MDFAMAIVVLVASVLAPGVANGIMLVAPYRKPLIDVVLVCINQVPLATNFSMIGLIVTCWTFSSI